MPYINTTWDALAGCITAAFAGWAMREYSVCCYDCRASQEGVNMSVVPMAPRVFFQLPGLPWAQQTECTVRYSKTKRNHISFLQVDVPHQWGRLWSYPVHRVYEDKTGRAPTELRSVCWSVNSFSLPPQFHFSSVSKQMHVCVKHTDTCY